MGAHRWESLDPGKPLSVPREFGWIEGLGDAVGVRRVPIWRRVVWGALFVFAFGVSIVLGGFLIGIGLSALLRLPDWAGMGFTSLIWTASAGAVGFWLGSRAFRIVVLYEHGIALKDAARIRAWGWDDIVAVERRPQVSRPEVPTDQVAAVVLAAVAVGAHLSDRPLVRTLWTYQFRAADGSAMMLDRWMDDVDTIGEVVDREVASRLTPVLRDQLQAGHMVSFGAITLSRDHGVDVRGRKIAWDEPTHVQVDRENVRVLKPDGRAVATAKIAKIDNLTVLFTLWSEMRAAVPPHEGTSWQGR